MTLADERYRAIRYAREFLRDLLNPKLTPKVPGYARKRASDILRHFPFELDMSEAALKAPKVFRER